MVTKISGSLRDANKAISSVNGFDFLSVLAGEKAHIAELMQPKFVSGIGLARLPRLDVYLQAIKQRIEKMVDNPARDLVAAQEFEQALGLYVFAGGTLPLPITAPEKLVSARWLLEEFRVSLFAQSLGAAETVSVQRIKKALS